MFPDFLGITVPGLPQAGFQDSLQPPDAPYRGVSLADNAESVSEVSGAVPR